MNEFGMLMCGIGLLGAVVEMLGLDLTSHDWKLKPISPRPMATTAQIMCRKVCSRCHVEMSDSTVDSLCSGKKK